MGIIHYAYFFEWNTLSAVINKCVTESQKVNVGLLRAQAQQALAERSEFGNQLLEDLRFDEEWMDNPSNDAGRTERLLMVSIAGQISRMHRMSQSSFALLESILPTLAWPKDKIRLLLMGRRFHELIESLKIPGL